MKRWTFSVLSALPVALLAALVPLTTWAQAYPAKPVRFVTGTAAGGLPDVVARLVAQKMSENWGTVIVENRPGAGYKIAAEVVANAPPDGYTLLFGDSAVWAFNPHLFSKLPYEPLKFAPVIQLARLPLFIAVPSSSPATNLAQLIAHAKQNPGKVTYGSSGIGSYHHIATEMFRSMAGIDIVHVPYKGAAQAGAALIANEIQMAFVSFAVVGQGVKSGQARVLAISTAERAPTLSHIPTVAEAGVPGYDGSATLGIVAPPGTPRDVIARLHAGIVATVPDVSPRVAAFGITVATSSPEQFGAAMRAEYDKFGPVIKRAGVSID
jgi:tripartite-type tricarboxylate transporter receptor subunit TctC